MIILKVKTFLCTPAIEKNIGKIISIVKIDGLDNDDLGIKIVMHIVVDPLAVDKEGR